MSNFTKLEEAALHAIFAETPELASILERQFEKAAVTKRENTGKGFFTRIAVPEDAPRANTPKVLGLQVCAHVAELTFGLGFAPFMENGRLQLLDGHAVGFESTASLNLQDLTFTIQKMSFGV